MTGPPDTAWLPALERRLGRPVVVTGREPLSGGYHGGVVRVDLDGAAPVVVKQTRPAEVAAMRALAVVRGVDRPRLLAAGADWIVTPFYDGASLPEGPDVPDGVWTTLARVHTHWFGRRPRGLPVTDAAWWRHLCVARILPHLHTAVTRTGDPLFVTAAEQLTAWADDPRMLTALARLPRTLTHGDAHRANILVPAPFPPSLAGASWDDGAPGPVLIDWGNARVAPAGFDLAVLRAQGATDLGCYRRIARAAAPELLAVEDHCADVYTHVGYLGFAADHLGPARVTEMLDGAACALDALGLALRRLGPAGSFALRTDTHHPGP